MIQRKDPYRNKNKHVSSCRKRLINYDNHNRYRKYINLHQIWGTDMSDDEDGYEVYYHQNGDEVNYSDNMNRESVELIRRYDDGILYLSNLSVEPKNENRKAFRNGVLTRYKKGREILPCRFGSLKIGMDIETNEYVVIKECRLKCVEEFKDIFGNRTIENVWQEIQNHQKLSTEPNCCEYIIKLLDVVEDSDNVYLVLEYAHRGDLREHLLCRNAEIICEPERQSRSTCLEV
jgi:hypothetical protein